MFEIVNDDGRTTTDGRTPDYEYPISSPTCMSLLGSGELINSTLHVTRLVQTHSKCVYTSLMTFHDIDYVSKRE